MGKKGKKKDKVQQRTDPAATEEAGAPAGGPLPAVEPSHVATRLNSAAIGLLRRLHRTDAALGVSSTRLSALSVLVLGGPRTLGQLAEAEGVTPPSMTRLVTAMEADGLVARSRSDDDGRLVIVTATARGTELLQWGGDARVAVLAGMVRELPEIDQRTLADAAGILEDLLRSGRRP